MVSIMSVVFIITLNPFGRELNIFSLLFEKYKIAFWTSSNVGSVFVKYNIAFNEYVAPL